VPVATADRAATTRRSIAARAVDHSVSADLTGPEHLRQLVEALELGQFG
jgi:hypothetical protein